MDAVMLRASPDWPRFDLASARPFLRAIGFEEDLLDRFVALWDGALAVDYRTMRDRLKTLALATATQTGVPIVQRDGAADLSPSDRIVLLDDDDWLAPDLFARLRPLGDPPVDGIRWRSVRIGLDHDPSAPGAAIVQCRPASTIVYTNNYAVAGASIAREGLDALHEHNAAQQVFDRADFAVADQPDLLSCAVKHPCCTTAARHLIADPVFRGDPVAVVAGFADRLRTAPTPPDAAWLAEPVAALAALLGEAAGV